MSKAQELADKLEALDDGDAREAAEELLRLDGVVRKVLSAYVESDGPIDFGFMVAEMIDELRAVLSSSGGTES